MSKTNNGGPAFPFPVAHGSNAPKGMSLRDWFAGQALAGMCAHQDTWGLGVPQIAEAAFALADAMLAEREKGGAE